MEDQILILVSKVLITQLVLILQIIYWFHLTFRLKASMSIYFLTLSYRLTVVINFKPSLHTLSSSSVKTLSVKFIGLKQSILKHEWVIIDLVLIIRKDLVT